MDWKYLLQTAHVHGMGPLLYWHLAKACPEAVPENDFDHLQYNFRANSLHNLFLTGELLRILNLLEANGVPAVPYKGPALAASVYGNIGLRRFIDLDIMVRRYDVLKAKQLLVSLGYRPQFRLTHTQEAALMRSRCDYVFTRDDGKSTVELHWEVTEHFSFRIDSDRLWGRLQQIPLGGDTVSTLSSEDTLLILCAHGAKHLWGRLGWICDVAELIRVCQDLNWEQVMAQADELGGERMLLLGLLLANSLLGVDLPERVSRKVHEDPSVKVLGERICRRLFRETNTSPELFEDVYFHPLHLKMKESLPDKLRYCLHAVTTQRVADWELLPLPNFLSPLYYVLRPIRLVGKYGPRVLKHLL